MTNTKSTKRALLSSAVALFLCFAMLLGTTFAWFTDSAVSSGNVIKAGTLDVEMHWAEGTEDPANVEWKDASEGAIFNCDKWEPGYTDAKHIKISNEGNLALKYQLAIIPTGEVSKLAEVIDVYLYQTEGVLENATRITDRTAIDATMHVGTLADVISKGIVQGNLAAEADYTTTIVLKMREDAGNEYQNLSIGDDFTVRLLATQHAAEFDSFDDQYDKDAWVSGMQIYTAADLQAAINAGETELVLMEDIELTESIVIPAPAATGFSLRSVAPAVVIDLNGKTIENANGYVIENQGNIVITGNGTLIGLGIIRSTAGSITIENGNFYASSKWQDGVYQHTLKAENTAVVINGGNFDATVEGHTNAMLNASTGSTITINGGNFKNVAGELGNFDPYIFHYEADGKVVINNGTFYGGWRFAGETATTDIYGGTFTVGYDGQSFNASSTHVLTVYGGTFTVGTKLADKLGELLADGYQAVETNDGTVVLPNIEGVTIKATDFAGIYVDGANAKSYYVFDKIGLMNLNALFAAIAPSEANINTVNLMADVDLAGEAWAPINSMWIVFNGNDHTISNLTAGLSTDGRRSGFWAYAGAVTINDLTLENVSVSGSQAGVFVGAAEGTKINNCFLRGNNTVTFVAGVEEWNGIAAICGVTTASNINVEIVDGATVTLNRGTMTTASGCTYIDDLTGHLNANNGKVTNNGTITVNGTVSYLASSAADVATGLEIGGNVLLSKDLSFNASETEANSGYGATGVSVKGGILDGNGYSLGINNWGTWDAAVHINGGIIKNLTVNSGMRGIFMGSATSDVYIDNVIIDGTVYTFNSDGGNKDYGVYITNSTLNGWTSFSDVHKEVVFTNCTFGEGSGYAFCRPYNASVFENCVFEEGFEFDTSKTSDIVFKNCYYGDTLITAENAASLGDGETTFFYNGLNGITIQ